MIQSNVKDTYKLLRLHVAARYGTLRLHALGAFILLSACQSEFTGVSRHFRTFIIYRQVPCSTITLSVLRPAGFVI